MKACELQDVLTDLQARLPGATWVEAEVPLDDRGVEVQGGLEAFTRAAAAVGATLLFYELSALTEADFAHGERDDDAGRWVDTPLGDLAAMQPFKAYLGQPRLLRVLFLHGGHRIEWRQEAPWMPEFDAALEVALTQHEQQQERRLAEWQAQEQVESARRAQVLREVLPNDPAFIALACEARPRITAMRERSDEVLEERLGSGSTGRNEDRVLRELAQQLREQHRKRR